MANLKNWVIAALAGALALSIVTGVVAQRQDGVTVELLVWQDTTDPERHHVSARLAGGSWRTHGTVEVELDQTTDNGRWRYGKHSFDAPVVATCASGIAVRDPSDHPELVADCRQLLAMRERFDPFFYDIVQGYESTPLLNWSAVLPMQRWTGVAVGGSPRRVVKLDLSGLDLHGSVSPRLGNLRGLTELYLNDTNLRGTLPSKLVQLTRLTHVRLSIADFEGCIPFSLWTVANNDAADVGLLDCGPPTVVAPSSDSDLTAPYLLVEGTYRYGDTVFDIPPGHELWLNDLGTGEEPPGVPWGFLLQTERSRWPESPAVRPDTLLIGEYREDARWTSDWLFDLVSESVWTVGR